MTDDTIPQRVIQDQSMGSFWGKKYMYSPATDHLIKEGEGRCSEGAVDWIRRGDPAAST